MWATARELMMIVVGPVVFGRVLCRYLRGLERIMEHIAPRLAPLTILWIIAVVVGQNRERLAEGVAPVIAALAGINLTGYVIGYWSGAALGFSEGVRRALTIEIGMQNAALGVAVAQRLFPQHPAAMIPPALFTVLSMITATLLAQWWAWRARQAEMSIEPETASGATCC